MGDDLKQKSNQMMKQSFLSDLLTFVETILAEDHPVMSRQIRRNIIKLVKKIIHQVNLGENQFYTIYLLAREQGPDSLFQCTITGMETKSL